MTVILGVLVFVLAFTLAVEHSMRKDAQAAEKRFHERLNYLDEKYKGTMYGLYGGPAPLRILVFEEDRGTSVINSIAISDGGVMESRYKARFPGATTLQLCETANVVPEKKHKRIEEDDDDDFT